MGEGMGGRGRPHLGKDSVSIYLLGDASNLLSICLSVYVSMHPSMSRGDGGPRPSTSRQGFCLRIRLPVRDGMGWEEIGGACGLSAVGWGPLGGAG